MSDRAIAALEAETASRLLGDMLRVRRFEEKAAEMYAQGRIRGLVHLSVGQEAVAVGAISLLRPSDYIVSSYRAHGHALARGLDPGRVMAELFGRTAGLSRGRGGSMHLFDTSRRFMGGYANVAGQMPIACGIALANQRQGNDDVVLCIFGDGAVNAGAFHESMNLASLWRLPLLFLCENNFYAMGTATRRAAALSEIYKRAEAYGMRSAQCDGMDVIAVRDHVDTAIKALRRNEGPYFLEAITYRFQGHSMGEPELYRDQDEIDHWRGRDPITAFSERCLRTEKLTRAELEQLERLAESEAQAAVAFAEASPPPEPDSLFDGLYAEATAAAGR